MTGFEPTPVEVTMAALKRRFQAEMVKVNATPTGGVRDNHLKVAFSAQLAADELAFAAGMPVPDWAALRDAAFAQFLDASRNSGRVTNTGLPLNQEQTRRMNFQDVQRNLQVARSPLVRHPAADPMPPVQRHKLRLLQRVADHFAGGGRR